MLVNGLAQFEDLVKEKKYGEVAQTLSVRPNLSSSLNIRVMPEPWQSVVFVLEKSLFLLEILGYVG